MNKQIIKPPSPGNDGKARQHGYSLVRQSERAQKIFITIVEAYLTSGEPIGSRQVSRYLPMALSPASVRNVMADLEEMGLIRSPHTSAGRIPTDRGLSFFVDSFLQLDHLDEAARGKIEQEILVEPHDPEHTLRQTSQILSSLSRGAGLVISAKTNPKIKQIEFIQLEPGKALVVMVSENNNVENRIITIPADLPATTLELAGNFLNAHCSGKTLAKVRQKVEGYIEHLSSELDILTQRVIAAGLASWSSEDEDDDDARMLIVHGRAHLLDDLNALDDLERIKNLFSDLENRKEIIKLLTSAETGDGVHIFIGSQNKLFSLSGSSLIVSHYHDVEDNVTGVLGVIGPTRQNYARIIPVVNYTAQIVSEILSKK